MFLINQYAGEGIKKRRLCFVVAQILGEFMEDVKFCDITKLARQTGKFFKNSKTSKTAIFPAKPW